ncbi:MAG: TonB family protein [Terracidiphilus sp.]
MKIRMRPPVIALAFLALTAMGTHAEEVTRPSHQYHQVPDQDGIYYVGPEVAAPRLVRTVLVPYPGLEYDKHDQGMTVVATVIDSKGRPTNIQVLHKHGDAFDDAVIAAVKASTFVPGTLAGKPVPVWIDVRVVFHANHSQAIPQVLITERDLPAPDESQFEDKHHKALSYTPPIPIHTVDADFADPFAKNPYIQVALVDVLVGADGLPKEVRVARGLGFGLDEKASAAVWHYRFLPATKKGIPISARKTVMVSFATF